MHVYMRNNLQGCRVKWNADLTALTSGIAVNLVDCPAVWWHAFLFSVQLTSRRIHIIQHTDRISQPARL